MTQELKNIFWDDVESVEIMPRKQCFDVSLLEDDVYRGEGNFIAEDFVVHNCGADKMYCNRKKGEAYELHPLLKPILENTYAVPIYQEQIMEILRVVGGVPKGHCEKLRKAISKKKEGEFEGIKDKFISHALEIGFDEKKAIELFEQVAAWSGYGFNRSHSCSYSYTAARLLWLKTHYPLEFFAATLQCEGKGEKIKEYKLEAHKCGIEVNRVDINKSGWDFNIVDKQIYMGFSNMKGIGEDIAKRIVENQPYLSFSDFLSRFGADAKVVKPLIALAVFKDADRATLAEFYEFYKDHMKKRGSRDERNARSRDGMVDEMRYLLPDKYKDVAKQFIEKFMNGTEEEFVLPFEMDKEQAWKVIKKYKKSIDLITKKQSEDTEISFDKFRPTGKIEDKNLKELVEALPQMAEQQYYGFVWNHVLEYSPDYKGFTFDAFEDDDMLLTAPVEVQVCKQIMEKKSKKGTKYYLIRVEDAMGKQNNVTIWEPDYIKFKEEFDKWDEKQLGYLMRVRLERPGMGFHSYTFSSPSRQLRHKDAEVMGKKEFDGRLALMTWPTPEQMKEIMPVKHSIKFGEVIEV